MEKNEIEKSKSNCGSQNSVWRSGSNTFWYSVSHSITQCTVIEEFKADLLHEDLRVIRYHVPIYHRTKGDVVSGRLDVLVHQLPETLPTQTVHQLCIVPCGAANLLGQDLGINLRSVVHRPTGDGWATLSNGPLEQPYTKTQSYTPDVLKHTNTYSPSA